MLNGFHNHKQSIVTTHVKTVHLPCDHSDEKIRTSLFLDLPLDSLL